MKTKNICTIPTQPSNIRKTAQKQSSYSKIGWCKEFLTLASTLCSSLCLVGILSLLFLLETVSGQYYISQQGHLLDANPRVGSFGLNTAARLDSLIPRANLYITGNVTGGASFQGAVPYRSPNEFQSTLGSSTLGNFMRDSVGVQNLSRPAGARTPYVSASSAVTSSRGRRVVNTRDMYSPAATPVGATLMNQSRYNRSMSLRPLSRNYSLGGTVSTPAFRPAATAGSIVPIQRPWGTPSQSSQTQIGRVLPGTADSPSSSLPAMEQSSFGSLRSSIQRSAGLNDPAAPVTRPGTAGGLELTTTSAATNTADTADSQLPPGVPSPLRLPKTSSDQPGAETKKGIQPSVDGGTDLAEAYRKQTDYYTGRGEELMRQKKYYQAAKAFEAAALYQPSDPAIHLARAHALIGAGEYMSASLFIDKAIELSPQIAGQPVNLNQLFPDKEKFQEQLAELDLWQKRTGQPMLKFLKGYILYHSGSAEEAHQVLTESLQLQPQSRSTKHLLDAVEADIKK